METKKDNTSVYSVTYTNNAERDEKMKDISSKFQKVVDMGNGVIKYCNFVYSKPKNKDNRIIKTKDKIYNMSEVFPKTKGSTIKVRFKSGQQKQHLINNSSNSYSRYELNEQEKYIELINRKNGSEER